MFGSAISCDVEGAGWIKGCLLGAKEIKVEVTSAVQPTAHFLILSVAQCEWEQPFSPWSQLNVDVVCFSHLDSSIFTQNLTLTRGSSHLVRVDPSSAMRGTSYKKKQTLSF